MAEPWVDITTRSKMNQKAAYSVLFCALLASTFVHELRAKGVAPVSSRHHHRELLSRAASSQTCELTCTWTQTGKNLSISVEVIDNVLVVANYTGFAAVLIDIGAQIVLAINGTDGSGVAINIIKQTIVSFKSGLWVGSAAELKALITVKLSGDLTTLWNLSGGVTGTVAAIASAQLQIITQVVAKLIHNIASQIIANSKVALTLLLTISTNIIALFTAELSGILALLAEKKIDIATDFSGLVVVLRTLAGIVKATAGNLTKLLALGVALKLALILGARNGIVALAHLILQIGAVAVAAAALAVYLSTAAIVFGLIAGLAGGVSVGLNGVLAVVASVAALANNSNNLGLVINKAIEVSIEISGQSSLYSEFNASIFALSSAVNQISTNFTAVTGVITSLTSNTLIIGGVNISAALTALLSVGTSAALIEKIVTFVLLLKPVIAEHLLAVVLILTLFSKLKTEYGIKQLIALGILISIGFDLLATLSAAATIIWGLLTGNILGALKSIPGLGVVINIISGVWVGGVTVFAALLVTAKLQIVGWFQYISGLPLGASSSSVDFAKNITVYATDVAQSTALSYSSSFVFSVSASSSGSVSVSA